MAGRHTPVMQQHADAKRAHPDAIVFFRLGDFYEMFGEDAIVGAKALDLTLTSRNKGKPDEVPMAGVPHHAAPAYIARLLALGHKVALCEQMADPATVKGIVPREVVRVITPGLVTDHDQLDSDSNNWLCAVELGASIGFSLLDVSTAELRAAEIADAGSLLAELSRAVPREVLFGGDEEQARSLAEAVALVVPRAARRFDVELAESALSEQLGDLAAEAGRFGAPVARAAARALRYVRACNPGVALPFRRFTTYDPQTTLAVDPTAQAHLELVTSVSGSREATLLGVLDRTRTPAGARLLRRRILAPLLDVEGIRRRLDRVELFVVHTRLREDLASALSGVGDLERLSMRAALGEATPRDLGALRDGLGAAARATLVASSVKEAAEREALGLEEPLDCVEDLREKLAAALVERPPSQLKDGGVFAAGFDAELDELDALRRHGAERMVELEARLREQTNIGTLKVRYTRVFGWYIEVSKGQATRAPSEWRRKQTVASGERYTDDELDDLADRITTAEERHRLRELELFRELVDVARAASERIGRLSERLARWDVAAGLAEVAHRYDYARPAVDDSDRIEIRDGRHPVVERLAARGRFVPNDVVLDLEGERLWLVTGPNMAGKSTLLRQVALTVVMAQLGSYVPARSARIGIVDRVSSRVGASDNLTEGESTFMVEMRETAQILRTATRRSLVILDEIGRGTSTFDGLAIAWAVAEYLDDAVGCRALFATHYHELTKLSESSAHVANYSVSARELADDVVFLHRLVPGAASRSYGVAVAKLAGLPEPVLARARALLQFFERDGAVAAPRGARSAPQLHLFRPNPRSETEREVLDTLGAVEVDRMTGLEALGLLERLRRRLIE
jgi:DNA mismatch repair protein MutS